MLLAPGGTVSILQSPPRLGERISRILREECAAAPPLPGKLALAEEEFFNGASDADSKARWSWDANDLEKSFGKAGFTVTMTTLDQQEDRLITAKDLSLWFDKEKSAWGAFVASALGDKDFEEIRQLLENRVKEGPIRWKWRSLLLKGTRNEPSS